MSSSEKAVCCSPERRLEAITAAARELKDRILGKSNTVEEATPKVEESRLFPCSRDAELNQLGLMTSIDAHVNAMEKKQEVSLAQQQKVEVSQLQTCKPKKQQSLKTQDEAHQKETREAVTQTELVREAVDKQPSELSEESRKAREEVEGLCRIQDMQERLTVRLNEQDRKLAIALEEMSVTLADINNKLTQFTRTNSAESSEPTVPLSLVKEIAESAAVAAAREIMASSAMGMVAASDPQQCVSHTKSPPGPPAKSLVYEDNLVSVIPSKAVSTSPATTCQGKDDMKISVSSVPEEFLEVKEDSRNEERSSEEENSLSSGESEISGSSEEEEMDVDNEGEKGKRSEASYFYLYFMYSINFLQFSIVLAMNLCSTMLEFKLSDIICTYYWPSTLGT